MQSTHKMVRRRNTSFHRFPIEPCPATYGAIHVAHQHPGPAVQDQAFHNGKFIEVTEQSLKGKWSVLIFMPAAFTFNCPTEVEDAADNYAEFQKLEAEVYIVTTDTHFSHKVWHETSPAVGKAQFPLVGDPTHTLTAHVRRAHRRRRPGAARHLRDQPGGRDQDGRSARQRDRA